MRHDRFKFRKLVLVRLDECQFVGCDVFLQENRLVLRHRREAPDALPHFLGVQMQPPGDRFRVRVQISRRIAQQERGKRGVVIDNDAAFTIQDFAARRQNRHIANSVLLRQLRVLAALHHLQLPQPVSQKQENEQYDVLHGGEPERGNFFFAAEHPSSIPASRHRRPSPKSAIPVGLESTGNLSSILTCSPSCPKYCNENESFRLECW